MTAIPEVAFSSSTGGGLQPVRSHRRAAQLLAEADPVLAGLLAQVGPPVIR
jgi:hypothetical protein